ncbi:S16 family serine protease [Bacillus infantis]|uniref:S16 family serine protease n=1 Tax=Bacillus infantis TaxID=324767 RepID=UPI003CE69EEB
MYKTGVIAGIMTFFFYIVFLLLYLFEIINEYAFVFMLFLLLVILLNLWFVFRQKRKNRIQITVSAFLLVLLFCYELPLLLVALSSPPSHVAYAYQEPNEALKGSGIFSVGVAEFTLKNQNSEQDARKILAAQGVDVLSIAAVDHKIRYESKNRQLLKWLHLQKEPLLQMEESAAEYLGKEEDWLRRFIQQPDIAGNSAGLSLALSGLINEGRLENRLPIAVTGAINEHGEVSYVGLIKEKIRIAEKAGFSYLIIPSENAEEAAAIQKESSRKIEIIDASHVDEAVKAIGRLNEGELD